MRTCYVHIGMHKTGSTAVQTAFHGYDDGKTAFLRTGKPNHSSPMLLLFSAQPESAARRLGVRAERLPVHIRSLRRSVVAQFEGCRSNFVISGESLSSDLSTPEIEELKRFLTQWFEEIRIIVYVRDPVSYLRSAFQQTVKSKTVDLDLAPFWPHYQKRIGAWTDVFGVDRVEAVMFDRDSLENGSVIHDFGRRIGADVSRIRAPYENRSLRAEGFALAYAIHAELGSGRLPVAKWVRHRADVFMTRRYGQCEFDFSDELYDPLLAQNAEDIAWAEQLLQRRFPSSGRPTNAVIFGCPDDILRYAASCRAQFDDWKRKQFGTGQRLAYLLDSLRRRLKSSS